MAKKTSTPAETSLVIVESPAKARTISKFLGQGYRVEASIGHVRDLPRGGKEMPEKYQQFKGKNWYEWGVNVERDFEPVYIVPKEKAKQVRKLKDSLKGAKELYLATDEDREGEAISWHLTEVLQPKVPIRRLVFHEITREAILAALRSPREIDDNLVRAQEVRRIVDRLYGYGVSPLLWRKIGSGLSAGRVQSVAVRLIVDRERARIAFVPATYWDLLGTFAKANGERFVAELVSVDGRRLPASRDFDQKTGLLKEPNLLLLDQQQAEAIRSRLHGAACRVADLENKPYTSKPYAPFTTSTLQQEANRKYGFTARQTMRVAQSLYENGHITYMRTDSTTLASVAVSAARSLIASRYGQDYLPQSPRVYVTKVKNAQEAHEAIRPAGSSLAMPETLRSRLNPEEFKLYDLIWKRTIASQMADARGHRVTITVEADGAVFQASGRTVDFPGYLLAYVEGSDDPEAELADRDELLPSVAPDESLTCAELESKGHTTKPPNRYSEASLTRTLEEMGIGRPSTYATIIETILARQYVFKRGNVLAPTWTAFAVCKLLEDHLPDLIDYQFTAEMEDELDAISRGELGGVDYLRTFYYGNAHPGLEQQLANKIDEIDAREVCQVLVGKPEGGEDIYVRVGRRYGPFLQQGQRRASLPDDMAPDEVTVAAALAMLDKASAAEEPLGICPDTHKPVYLKMGRFGPYVQRGAGDDDQKPQNASLLPGMKPEDVDLGTALRLLSLPRTLGNHPATDEPVVAQNGRYGPFVKCGEETRSLPPGISPLEVTLDEAIALLSQPKQRRGARAKKEPIRVFEPSPVTGEPIRLLDGRYGPYVTDGQTNASVPRGLSPEEVTFQSAVELLRDRAEKAPPKRPARRRTASRKGATPAKKRPAKATAGKRPKKKPASTKRAKKGSSGETGQP
jgi:DNA topoisomerase-1